MQKQTGLLHKHRVLTLDLLADALVGGVHATADIASHASLAVVLVVLVMLVRACSRAMKTLSDTNVMFPGKYAVCTSSRRKRGGPGKGTIS